MSVTAVLNNLLFSKSMQDKPAWIGELRSYADTPADVAKAWVKADELGVQIKGRLTYQEQKELDKLNPSR